jgi:hypothetical protein
VTAITWEQSPERSTWLAQVPGTKVVLAVTRLGANRWLPAVQDEAARPGMPDKAGGAARRRGAGGVARLRAGTAGRGNPVSASGA